MFFSSDTVLLLYCLFTSKCQNAIADLKKYRGQLGSYAQQYGQLVEIKILDFTVFTTLPKKILSIKELQYLILSSSLQQVKVQKSSKSNKIRVDTRQA